MKVDRMETPDTREEFEKRMNMLHYSIQHEKTQFAPGMTILIEDLTGLRSMPNGRLDLLTVNEAARLHANMMVQLDEVMEMAGEKNSDGEDI